MRQDNRGMTLLELIIAITISTLIMGAVTLVLQNALKSYKTASAAVDLQMESHVLVEQLSSWIMEGNLVEVTDDNVLVIYNVPRQVRADRLPPGTTLDASGRVIPTTFPDGVTPNPEMKATKRMIWLKDGSLYMLLEEGITDPYSDTTNKANLVNNESENRNCISEFASSFIPKWNADNETLSVTMTLKSGTQEYTTMDVISMRNILSTPMPSASPAPATTPPAGS